MKTTITMLLVAFLMSGCALAEPKPSAVKWHSDNLIQDTDAGAVYITVNEGRDPSSTLCSRFGKGAEDGVYRFHVEGEHYGKICIGIPARRSTIRNYEFLANNPNNYCDFTITKATTGNNHPNGRLTRLLAGKHIQGGQEDFLGVETTVDSNFSYYVTGTLSNQRKGWSTTKRVRIRFKPGVAEIAIPYNSNCRDIKRVEVTRP